MNEIDPSERFYFRVMELEKQLQTIIADYRASKARGPGRRYLQERAITDPRTGKKYKIGKGVRK